VIGPEILSTVNHVLNNHSKFCFSEHFRLDEITHIKLNEFVNLVFVGKNVHDVGLFVVSDVTATASNS